MGYTTEFYGEVNVDPPLNGDEISYLRKFAETRRMNRTKGPYFVDGAEFMGQAHEEDILDYNSPPPGQPGLWCQWVPTDDGRSIVWDQGEKFYDADAWMVYLINHFLKVGAHASIAMHDFNINIQYFKNFQFNHVLNGEFEAIGEESDDRWLLVVTNNIVTVKQGKVVYDE